MAANCAGDSAEPVVAAPFQNIGIQLIPIQPQGFSSTGPGRSLTIAPENTVHFQITRFRQNILPAGREIVQLAEKISPAKRIRGIRYGSHHHGDDFRKRRVQRLPLLLQLNLCIGLGFSQLLSLN